MSDRIDVGKKNLKSNERRRNVDVTKGLIRSRFARSDTPALSHGPAMLFDFENSIRRSRTETGRYEFKQGILRLDNDKARDPKILEVLVETICAIANCGPHSDGYLYIGIADSRKDAERIKDLYDSPVVEFDRVFLVGVDREANHLSISLDTYFRQISSHLAGSRLSSELKTQVCASIDLINYKGVSVIRVRVPRQSQVSFVGDKCFIRSGSSTNLATGPEILSISRQFESASK